jgi:hypothetical protein
MSQPAIEPEEGRTSRFASRRPDRAPKPVSGVYLDIEAIASWLRLAKIPVKLEATPLPDGRQQFVILDGAGDPILPALIPYSSYPSISVKDLRLAIDQQAVMQAEDAYYDYRGKKTSILDILYEYTCLAYEHHGPIHFYRAVGDFGRRIGVRIFARSCESSTGPRGGDITIITLAVGADVLAKITCSGVGYDIVCPGHRVLEEVTKVAPPEMARRFISKIYGITL